MKNDKTILQADSISISFGGIKAVDDLSFHVENNEIYGLIGPNGAGKTTVFNLITGFYRPDAGEIFFRANDDEVVDLTKLKTENIIKKGLVRTFQNIELIGDLSLIDNVLIGSHIKFKSGLFSSGFKLPSSVREEKSLREEAQDILKYLELYDIKEQLVYGMPYGILKRIELARTLVSKPKMIILDEPAAGLNETETNELATLLKKIRDDLNVTILLVEHDMRLVMSICDRLLAISFGKKLKEGLGSELQSDEKVREAYLGREED